jgi:hypothetical protein
MSEITIQPTGIANDDTNALQQAILDPCVREINIGLGTLAFGKRALRACVRVSDRPTPLVIRGEHEHGTVIKLVDMDGGLGGDTHMFAFDRCDDLTVQNLTLDGNRGQFPAFIEHAHGIYINGCERVNLLNIHTRSMIMDGMYFLGEAEEGDPLTQHVNIIKTTHANNNRSGLAFQRGVRNVVIDGLIAKGLSDAAIDTEASGTPAENFIIRNASVYPINDTFSISIGGFQGTPCRNFLLENIYIANGSMGIYHAHNATLRNVSITGRTNHSPLFVRGNIEQLNIIGGTYTDRQSTAGEDGAISIGSFNGTSPKGVFLYDTRIHSTGQRSGISAEDVEFLSVYGGEIIGSDVDAGIRMRNVSRTGGMKGLYLNRTNISSFYSGISLRPYADRRIRSLISERVIGRNLSRGIYVEGSAYLDYHLINNTWDQVTSPEVYE